jgi:hypothetical protein
MEVPRRRCLPYPLRYTAGAPGARGSDFARPISSSTSWASSTCSMSCIRARANASRVSHTGLDSAASAAIFFDIAVAPFVRALGPWVLAHPKGVIAFSIFPHPLKLPREPRRRSSGEGQP